MLPSTARWQLVNRPEQANFGQASAGARRLRTQCREYELANHLAGETLSNVLATVSDAKLPEAKVLSFSDYYAFGSAMPGRSGGAGYRHGFNTQERSPELAPDHHTAEFWEYDARTGRRWNVDPVVKPHESGYACLLNAPIGIIDPNGDDGIATVDKDAKTISIKQVFYYNKNDPNMEQQVITKSKTWDSGPFKGDVWPAEIDLIRQKGFSSKEWVVPDNQGNNWTLSFSIEFVGLDGDEEVDKALTSDGTANKFIYDPDLTAAGRWYPSERKLSIGVSRRQGEADSGTTSVHEVGHSWGLPHENEMPESPIHGLLDNGVRTADENGIMSYSAQRAIKTHELKFGMMKILETAATIKDKVVRVHIVGFVKTNANKVIPQKKK